ncbi:MAG: thioredoxin domain-containing protein, partial [Halobacteriales archaeon]
MTNALAEEESPYLLQHADNPVDWKPWGEEAFDEARDRDVPVFLSVGYAACHWCHVMAEESFEDPDVAEKLNEGFVPVKVDREEHPDVDRVYQTACRMTTGGGGWPLSVWLTPDGHPFYAGTYFPPEPKHGRPDFGSVLDSVTEAWRERRDEVERQAVDWTDEIQGSMDGERGSGGPERALEAVADAAVERADRDYGGFGRGQKFPHATRHEVLLRAHDVTGDEVYADVAREALDAMAEGGLRDHVGGGFHRYCVDRGWTVPHFEKMLYDNATLARLYLSAYEQSGRERYADVARDTLEFVSREMQAPDGGFAASLDARSPAEDGERVEGYYYTWTPGEIEDAVGDEGARAVTARYGVTDGGDVEGRSVLAVRKPMEDIAGGLDVDVGTARSLVEDGLRGLKETRDAREPPAKDDKVLAGWNGLAVSAFAR